MDRAPGTARTSRRRSPTFRRAPRCGAPGAGRHNIAEIALHHASCVRAVIGRLSGKEQDPFVLEGEDWFEASDGGRLDRPAIRAVAEDQLRRLRALVAGIAAARVSSPLDERERFDLALGVTCHAVYHAGQVQLIKVLAAARGQP